jgi:alpha-glucosidase
MTKKLLLAFLLVFSCSGALGRSGWQAIGGVTAVKALPNGLELAAGTAGLQILALTPTVIRLLYTPDGTFPADHSFAVLPNVFPKSPKTAVEQQKDSVILSTETLQITIDRSSMSVSFRDAAGKFIARDSSDAPVWFNGNAFRVWKVMPEDEHYFALGDKTGPLDHRSLAFTMWNTDAYGWEESTDPLYKDIPFLLAMRKGAAYGLFLDNTYRSSFDLGKSDRNFYSFNAEGGSLDYYFIYGPDPKKVVEDFTTLVGRTPLPPLFALGFQQSRYSYYPESQVREIASEFRKRKIPADVLYLDIDYQQDNRPFTINRERFPNFEGMVKDLKDEGFKLVLITDLHIAKWPGYKPYDEGIAHDYFVKDPDGSVYVGKVWPGDSVFPDFTRAEVRQWWGSLYADFVKMGVRGFWNDMNEPALFERADKTMPLDIVHRVDRRKTDHREIHNVYGMENVHGTYEGLLRLQPDLRPFVLTRAAYAGAQRYAATWTGDNSSMWNHMRISIPQILNLGLSGFAFAGADVGGFRGSPTPELLTRWMELGAFNPFYRNHGEKNSRFREPWVDGPEHEAIRRKYIETRYRLLPYIYTEMEESSRTGIPLMRPMFLEFPGDPALSTNDEEFMFGDSLLVASKVWEFTAPYEITFPQGDWYDYWTGGKVSGGKKIKVDPPLDTLPVYVRAGAIIPQQPVVQYVGEPPKGPLQVRVYSGPDCRGDLYMDDGSTLAYQRGEFSRVRFTCEAAADHLQINVSSPQGPYRPWFNDVQVIVYGARGDVGQVSLDGKPLPNWKVEGGTITLPAFAQASQGHEISVIYAVR